MIQQKGYFLFLIKEFKKNWGIVTERIRKVFDL